MAFSCGFYNAINQDRTYSAIQFGEMFDGLINDGVYSTIGEAFMVVPGAGMTVNVKSGRAWFNKTWSVNTTDFPLDLGLADLLLPRIDTVILEVDTRVSVRNNSLKVVQGYPNVNPTPAALTQADGLYQYPLAHINVKANATAITKTDITVVVGQPPCPFVTGILQSVDITDLYQQWEGQFEDWFEEIKTILDGDVVGNILHQLDQKVNKSDKASTEDALLGTDDTKWMTPKTVKEVVLVTEKIGTMKLSSRKPDDNWMLCDGKPLSKSEYPDLFDIVGYKYGYGKYTVETLYQNSGAFIQNSSRFLGGFTYVDSNNYILLGTFAHVVLKSKAKNVYFSNYMMASPIIYYKNYFYGVFEQYNGTDYTKLYFLQFTSSNDSPSTYLVNIPDTIIGKTTSSSVLPRFRGYSIISDTLHVIIAVNVNSGTTMGLYHITFNGINTTCNRILKNSNEFMSIDGFLLDGVYYDSGSMMCYDLLTKSTYSMALKDQNVMNELKTLTLLNPGVLDSYDCNLICDPNASKVLFRFHYTDLTDDGMNNNPVTFIHRVDGSLKYTCLKYGYNLTSYAYNIGYTPYVTNISSLDGMSFSDSNSRIKTYTSIIDDKVTTLLLPNEYPRSVNNPNFSFVEFSGYNILSPSVYPLLSKTSSSSNIDLLKILKCSRDYFSLPNEASYFVTPHPNNLYIKVKEVRRR